MKVVEVFDEFSSQSMSQGEKLDFLYRREKAFISQFVSYAQDLEDQYKIPHQLASNTLLSIVDPKDLVDDLVSDLRTHHIRSSIMDNIDPKQLHKLQTLWLRAVNAKRDLHQAVEKEEKFTSSFRNRSLRKKGSR